MINFRSTCCFTHQNNPLLNRDVVSLTGVVGHVVQPISPLVGHFVTSDEAPMDLGDGPQLCQQGHGVGEVDGNNELGLHESLDLLKPKALYAPRP